MADKIMHPAYAVAVYHVVFISQHTQTAVEEIELVVSYSYCMHSTLQHQNIRHSNKH
jgi:hypothetical protein